MLEEFRDLKSAGLKPMEILQTATVHPATFIKEHAAPKALFGEIRKGYRADLLLLEKNPLENLLELDKSLIGVAFNGRYAKLEELRELLREQTKDF
jgi:imidazolonepropionase-like amidohydrolase